MILVCLIFYSEHYHSTCYPLLDLEVWLVFFTTETELFEMFIDVWKSGNSGYHLICLLRVDMIFCQYHLSLTVDVYILRFYGRVQEYGIEWLIFSCILYKCESLGHCH